MTVAEYMASPEGQAEQISQIILAPEPKPEPEKPAEITAPVEP